MSHVVEIKIKVRDLAALQAACRHLNLPEPQQGEHKLFGTMVSGLAVQLPGWKYPAVFDLTTGDGKYDNYNGSWGAQGQLDSLLQRYTAEKTKIELRRKGFVPLESREGNKIVIKCKA